MQTILCFKLQGLSRKFQSAFHPPGTQPPGDAPQGKRLQLGVDGELDVIQGQICCGARGLALDHIDPGPHGTRTLRKVHPQISVAPQLGQIDLHEIRVQLPSPFAPEAGTAREKRLLENAGHTEACAPMLWWSRIQPHGMGAVLATQDPIDPG